MLEFDYICDIILSNTKIVYFSHIPTTPVYPHGFFEMRPIWVTP